MAKGDAYRKRADELLRLATAASSLSERSRLIGEAVRWHMMAGDAEQAGGAEQAGEPGGAADAVVEFLDEDPGAPEPDAV